MSLATTGGVSAERLYGSLFSLDFHLSPRLAALAGVSAVSSKAQPVRCGSWPKVSQSAARQDAAPATKSNSLTSRSMMRRQVYRGRQAEPLDPGRHKRKALAKGTKI